jgi:O-antigen/teichoic acid export membrane protein
MQSEVRKLARGGSVMLAATLVGNALLLVLDVYANGVLGNAGYGLFGAIRRVLQLGGFVVLLGMENAVIRYVATAGSVAAARSVAARALMGTALAGAACAALLAVLAEPFAAWIDPAPDTVLALRIGALALPLSAVRMVAVSASQGLGNVTHRAMVMFVAWPVAQLAGVWVLTDALGLGSVGAVGAYVAAMAVGAALALRLWTRATRTGASAEDQGATIAAVPAVASFGALFAFAWPMWVQGIVMAAYTWVDQVLLAGLRSAEEAGIYGPVAVLAPLYGLGLGALNGPFAPQIAERHAAGDREGLQRLYRTVTRWAVALAVPPIAVSIAASETVLALWPHGSPAAVPALRVACAASLFCTAVGSVNYLLIMAGRPRAALVNGLPALVLNVMLCVWLVPRHGALGAAVANAVAMCTANGLALLQVRTLLGVHPFDRALLKPLVAGAPACVAAWLGAQVPGPPLARVLCAGVAAGAAFFGGFVALGLGEDDRAVVQALRRRLPGGAV